MKINSFKEAEHYLEQFIPNKKGWGDPALAHERTVQFMKQLGDPQNKIRVIHVAGTSGKGSTCYAISSLLTHLGFKTGLTISPHLYDLRERVQLNNKLISHELFCQYLSAMTEAVGQMKQSKYGAPTFFEIVIALGYYAYWKEKVDYAVIETGMGGKYDAANTVTREDQIVVLTKIGLDHTEYLGNTLSKIAGEKTGIIQKNNIVLSTHQHSNVISVFNREAHKNKTNVIYIEKKKHTFNIRKHGRHYEFNFSYESFHCKNLSLASEAMYQVENVSLALAAVCELAIKDKFVIDEKHVRAALNGFYVPGRFAVDSVKGKAIIIDGAHNPQKMRAFMTSLIRAYPNQKYDFLIAFKKGKNYKPMLKHIIPYAHSITVTQFVIEGQGWSIDVEDTADIERILKQLRFKHYYIDNNCEDAFNNAMKISNRLLVVTGSLYLVGKIYSLLEK